MVMLILTLASWLASANAAYTLVSNYDATNFFDPSSFSFYNGYDKFTRGFANYRSLSAAQDLGLAAYTQNQVYLGVDYENTYDNEYVGRGNGRSSIRLEGVSTYNNGLFIGDFQHLPANACGQWPAFWLLHDDGDDNGYSEVDIIEGVSLGDQNAATLYTNDDTCTMYYNTTSRPTPRSVDCRLSSGGCASTAVSGTFGDSFNQNGGGFWANQVEADGIRFWYFAHGNEPADIRSASPDPSKWGPPMMNYVPNRCDITSAFRKMKIMINISFCGAYAGRGEWADTGCQDATGYDSCEAYVAENPDAFSDVNFLINSVKVFQRSQSSSSTSISTSTRTSTSSSTLSKTTSSSTRTTSTTASSTRSASSTSSSTRSASSTSSSSSTKSASSTSSSTRSGSSTSSSTRSASSASSSTKASSTITLTSQSKTISSTNIIYPTTLRPQSTTTSSTQAAPTTTLKPQSTTSSSRSSSSSTFTTSSTTSTRSRPMY